MSWSPVTCSAVHSPDRMWNGPPFLSVNAAGSGKGASAGGTPVRSYNDDSSRVGGDTPSKQCRPKSEGVPAVRKEGELSNQRAKRRIQRPLAAGRGTIA